MLIKCNIEDPHPLLNEPGVSQDERALATLNTENLKIDGRTQEDILDFVLHFSKYINFYEQDLSIATWKDFFEQSTPFLIARIGKISTTKVEESYKKVNNVFIETKSKESLRKLFEFVFDESILPILTWQESFENASDISPDFGLGRYISALRVSTLRDELLKFIHLKNGADNYISTRRTNWLSFNLASWDIDITDLYAVNIPFEDTDTEIKKLEKVQEVLTEFFNFFMKSIRGIVEKAPAYFEESLVPLQAEYQKKHQPHLGLFFTFLRLFKFVQDDLNKLSQKHLDFFYQKALQIKPKAAVPDKIHVIFEVAKQIEQYKIEQATRLKGNKDLKGKDILFDLDSEIVIDKTQIADLKTLYLNPIVGNPVGKSMSENTFLEGIYIAPTANSADGKGAAFTENQFPSWKTLGAKESKFYKKEKKTPEIHPKGRLGWFFASPVLLLNEGKRTITIDITCDASKADIKNFSDIVNLPKIQEAFKSKYYFITPKTIKDAQDGGLPADDLAILEEKLAEQNPYEVGKYGSPESINFLLLSPLSKKYLETKQAFKVALSGEKDWIVPKTGNLSIQTFDIAGSLLTITIEIVLENDIKPITFFNKEALKEDFKTKLPLVKIELDPDIQVKIESKKITSPECKLEKDFPSEKLNIALYHFLRCLTITDTKIDVQVCGVKNLIVQNDENLQDVNSPIYPFGVRPKIGSNFYIGSQEIFLKNWQKIGVNLEWKDKPLELDEYYHGYEDKLANPEIKKTDFEDKEFLFQASVLQNEAWNNKINSDKLFISSPNTLNCPIISASNYHFEFSRNEIFTAPQPPPNYKPKPIEKLSEKLSQLDVNTTDGFLKITLQNQDFQHSRYSYVLARQMMALGKFPKEIYIGPVYDLNGNPINPVSIDDAINALKNSHNKMTIDINPKRIEIENDIIAVDLNEIEKDFKGINVFTEPFSLQHHLSSLETILDDINQNVENLKQNRVVIPNEPYTPIIKQLSIDYTAKADIDDITYVHLYPFEGTYKTEDITTQPTLLPSFFDEGSLFLGFENLTAGTTLNLLFQLAEATADSEIDKIEVKWHYLRNNQWILLRTGFEIIADETLNLTASGIIKIAIPIDITKDSNTIMPANMHWLKASVCSNAKAIGETIGIHTQAAKATFQILGNDTDRLTKSLEAGSIAKLVKADFRVKEVMQPYESFGGQPAEISGHFYVRVSEQLRHKGRAINRFDYERLVLEEFSSIYRAKCISRTLGLPATNQYPCREGCGSNDNQQTKAYRRDLEIAPGYVLLALVPDIRQLKVGDFFEPRVPVSMLEKVEFFLKNKTSPFVRFKAMNPHYEKINLNKLKIRLKIGKNEAFYKNQLVEDLRVFIAPWAKGAFDKLIFGKAIYKSDIIKFIENLEYVDALLEIIFEHEDENYHEQYPIVEFGDDTIYPLTARSILMAGRINICIDKPDCTKQLS